MKASDIFVLPSRKEGLPNTIIEAIASGLPTIASRLPGSTDDIIANNKTGFLIEIGDSVSLANKILDLMQDKKKYSEISDAGTKSIRSKFDINLVADKTKALYMSLLNFPN